MFAIHIDRRGLEQLENNLDKFGEFALPRAVVNTLNRAAFYNREVAVRVTKGTFTLRNTFTTRSIQVNKAVSHRKIARIYSEMGSTQDYMAKQEEGFQEKASGPHGIAIPTAAAADQQGQERTRPIRRKNYLANIRINKVGIRMRSNNSVKATRKQLMWLVREAVNSSRRTFFFNSPYDKDLQGFYRVQGGRKTKRGWPIGAKVRKIYNVEKQVTITRPHTWMSSAIRKFTVAKITQFYHEELEKSMARYLSRR
jgi:hypothetical protein